MKKLHPLILMGCMTLLISTISCKKAIEKQAENLIMAAIVNGEWYVDQYLEGDNNVSNQFLDYTFKFSKDETVTGTLNGNATKGTWKPNASDYTIVSEFPNAGDPLKKMNGLWKIKDSDWEYVKAEMVTSTGTNVLKLRKK